MNFTRKLKTMAKTIINGFSIFEKENIPAGDNPFIHDTFNMGTIIGTNLVVMYKNHPSEKCDYLVIVNTNTGERITVIPK